MTPAELARTSRREQGLPDRIEDPAALLQVAQLLEVAQHRRQADAADRDGDREGGRA